MVKYIQLLQLPHS